MAIDKTKGRGIREPTIKKQAGLIERRRVVQSYKQARKERRQSPRYSFIEFMRCDKGGVFGTVGTQTNEIEGAIINVGKDGLCLLLREVVDPSTVIKIGLPIPIINVSTPTLAEIKWVKKRPWMKSSFAGCRFLI